MWLEHHRDEGTYHQRFTPRRARSPSSKRNVGIVGSYAVLHRIELAKRANTRARLIAQFVAMLVRGEMPYPQKRTTTRCSTETWASLIIRTLREFVI